jgi:hypothetical protein
VQIGATMVKQPLFLSVYIKQYKTISQKQLKKYTKYVQYLHRQEEITAQENKFIEDFDKAAEASNLKDIFNELIKTDISEQSSDEEEHKTLIEPNTKGNKMSSTKKLSVLVQRNLVSQETLNEYNQTVKEICARDQRTLEEAEFLADYFNTILKLNVISLPEQLPRIPKDQREQASKVTIKMNELVVKPETFDGQKPKPRKWLEDFKEAAESNGWNDEIMVKYFRTFLTGSAKDWYVTAVRPNLTANTTWDDINEWFNQQYLVIDLIKQQHYVDRLYQRPNETIEVFIPKIRRALQMLSPNITQEVLVRQIIDKLRPEYRKDAILHNPSTVLQLHQFCVRIEMGLVKN